MSKPYKLIIFDWEGTIADTLGQVLSAIDNEAQALGLPPLDLHQARLYVSLGLIQALRKLYPNLSLMEYERLLHAIQLNLVSHPSEVRLIPGAREFIHYVLERKIDIAIATNKAHHSLVKALQHTQLDTLFKVTRSAGEVPAKPCPQMLIEIMETFGIDSTATLMIGDSLSDMEMAEAANVASIGMDFYHQNNFALKKAGAVRVFDDYTMLAEYLGF